MPSNFCRLLAAIILLSRTALGSVEAFKRGTLPILNRRERFVQQIVIRRESALCRFAISRAPDTILTLPGMLTGFAIYAVGNAISGNTIEREPA